MFDNIQINIAGGLDIPLPKMVKVRQHFEQQRIDDVGAAITAELTRPEIASCIKPGTTIAIGVGSRGVANIDTAVKALVNGIKSHGGKPFVFPAMGGHAGATVAGQ